jgi:ADP-dependent NAD(P)H-hydrate dehydratase
MRPSPRSKPITTRLLRRWKLPDPEGGDKETRGRALIVAGCDGMPGAAILSATGALRAGAGKLQMAVPQCIASSVAQVMLEALVLRLPETREGVVTRAAIRNVSAQLKACDGLLVGPGMKGGPSLVDFLRGLVSCLEQTTLVLDAVAMKLLERKRDTLAKLGGRAIITPHAGEMASLLGLDKKVIEKRPAEIALRFAAEAQVVTVLKGEETFVASPDGKLFSNRLGNIGLGTSGSGDVLSGIITGLAARGAGPLQAAVWGVHLHARAGDRLARKHGRIGYLARELLLEIPRIMNKL